MQSDGSISNDDEVNDVIHTRLLEKVGKINTKDTGDDDDEDMMTSHFKMFLIDALKAGKKPKY